MSTVFGVQTAFGLVTTNVGDVTIETVTLPLVEQPVVLLVP